MVDLKAIQETLNKDAQERKKFETDPVGYLESKGLSLPDEAKKQLIANVKAHTGAAARSAIWALGVAVSGDDKKKS